MATFKAIVEPHYKRADGTYNIKIRVIHNRRKKIISTQLYLTEKELTRTFKIKEQTFIDATDDLLKNYRMICNRLGERLKVMTVEQIVDAINASYNLTGGFELDFVKFGRDFAAKLKESGREGSSKLYNVTLNSLIRYAGREAIDISEITAKYLTAYFEWLNNEKSSTDRVKGTRAPSLYLTYIRALHNAAKSEYNDEDRGVINIPFSPFVKFKVPKAPVTRKRALTIAQMQAVIDLPYKDEDVSAKRNQCNRFNLAKDVFILSFGMLGMNSVDLHGCTVVENKRVKYQRAKTKGRRDDNAEISVRIEPEIQPIFHKYRDVTGVKVFKFHLFYSNPSTFNAAINKGLKEVGKMIGVEDLEFYAARHSWATLARNKAKVDLYTVHNALNHADDGMKVTDIYLEKDFSLNDEANEKVLALLDFSSLSDMQSSQL